MNKIIALLIFAVVVSAGGEASASAEGSAAGAAAAAAEPAGRESKAVGARVPKTQGDFCAIISSTYNEWSAEVGKPAYIDQKDNANAIKQKGKQKLQEIAAENSGVFEGWQAVISAISVDAAASGVGLSVEFSCDVNWPQNLQKPILYNTDAFEGQTPGIQKGTAVYEALRKFKKGDTVFVAGRFLSFDKFLDTAADVKSSQCLVAFEGVGQTADESMAVAYQNRRQELAQMREKQEQDLAQQRAKQEQELAQEREKLGQDAQKQKAAEDKRRQDLAQQRAKQEQDSSPKSHEWYMENPKALDAKLKECREKSGVMDCPSAYQAKRRIDEGDLLRYKSVEWWMSNAKQRNAKLKECERMTMASMNTDCRNASTAEDRVLRRQLRQR